MVDRCPPLRLPIQVETSCGPRHDCPCDSNPCKTDCTIATPFSSQSSYQNRCDDKITRLPTIQIAFLSNVRSDCPADDSIILNPTNLTWCDFLTLFYRANNVFSINFVNQLLCPISFRNKTYENTTSRTLKFNLAQQTRIAWAAKCETNIDNIPPKLNILLNKDTFGIRSLINSVSSVSLTLDQAIEALLSGGEIAPGDSTDSAIVNFVVQYKYCFKPLGVCVLVNFPFITNIPCYKNTNFCDDWCPPYSNDKNCRNCGDLADETKDIMNYLNKNFKKNDTFSISDDKSDDKSVDDKSEVNEMDSVTMSLGNLKELQNLNDDNTHISMASSKW